MIYIYIATVVVMLGLILFTSVSIITISKTTCQNIKKKTMELTSLYDYLIEEHSQELRNKKRLLAQLEQELEPAAPVQAAQPQPVANVAASTSVAALQTVEKISKATYLNEEMAQTYQEIRSHFSQDFDQVLQKVPALATKTEKSAAECILELFSYETIYSMSFLAQQEQLECIQAVLPVEYTSVLEQFLSENDAFFSLDFYTYLKEQAEQESQKMTIYVSPNVAIDASQQLPVEVNEDICEGIQVEVNHQLYDFAIEKKEMGWVCQH